MLDIVLVEDSDDDYYAFQRACVGTSGAVRLHRYELADEARAALDELARGGARVLTVLDLNLPGKDGRTLLTELRDARWSGPIIIFSSSADEADVRFCYERHANAYHVKPLGFRELREQLSAIVDYWARRARVAAR